MIKAISVVATLMALACSPALAQEGPARPPGTTTPAQQEHADQQARSTPEDEERQRPTDAVETLRQPSMSSPNVAGEHVPEAPATGLPQPGADPEQLESVPRP